MKKTFLILAALLCSCFALKAQEQFTSDGLNYSVTGTNPPTVELTGHTEGFTAHDLVIPASVTNGSTTYSVTSIGDEAFDYCSGLTGSLTISNSVTSIGDGAFYECTNLTGSLTIPNSVVSIGNEAFYGCSGFTGSLTIPNSVKNIGNNAFLRCSGLTDTLTIGSSVESIGDYAFALTNLSKIIVKPVTPPNLNFPPFLNSVLQSITVPCGRAGFYKYFWKFYADKIDDGFVYELTVASANPEFGSASITQSATCENHQATVTATPAEISRFTGWTENGVQVSTDNPYTFSYESDHNLVANFESIYDYNPITSLPSSYDDVYVLGYQDGDDYYLHTSGTAAGEMKLSLNPAYPVEYKFTYLGYVYNLVYAHCDNGALSITT
ncbi:MAG: leucine-rich repeat domain-containing protein, partial [Bacteroidales bacterium]|nr:leucine-rich repeat domain-containing protein [Bacteroidales bacterium]